MNKVDITHNTDGSFLNLPSIKDDLLPTVTIVTPTCNRRELFEIAIRNYKNFDYPRNKLSWIILDDSKNDLLKNDLPDDKSIKYIYSNTKETIGKKRNILANESNSQVICHMDDDDYYYPDSVKVRVISLISHNHDKLVDSLQYLDPAHFSSSPC